jgi:hypothetical protein
LLHFVHVESSVKAYAFRGINRCDAAEFSCDERGLAPIEAAIKATPALRFAAETARAWLPQRAQSKRSARPTNFNNLRKGDLARIDAHEFAAAHMPDLRSGKQTHKSRRSFTPQPRCRAARSGRLHVAPG